MATLSGLVASMASYIAVNPAFDIVVAEDNAVFMIHNVWGGAVGDYREMQKTADVFKGLSSLLAQAYCKKTKKSGKEIQKMMDDETWLFGSEILESGFVDEIIKTNDDKNKSALVAKARLNFDKMTDGLIDKTKAKADIQKVAACLNIDSIENNSIPTAESGKNKEEDLSIMDKDELKTKHPELFAEVAETGKSEEKSRIKDLIDLKGKAEFKSHPAIMARIDEAIVNGESLIDCKLALMAILSNGNIQASLESPKDIATGSETSASAEKKSEIEENRIKGV